MSAPNYGQAFALWRAQAPEWHVYTQHAFVEGLRTGTLPRDNFLHYLKQDYIFLIHFARAWALAAAKAETLAEIQAAAATVKSLAHHEMPLHVQICASAGIDAAALQATEEAPANLAYTRDVLEAGYSGDFLDLMAALTPCVLGYGEIGARLRGSGGSYCDCVNTYAGEGYQELCRDVGELIDNALIYWLGSDWVSLPRARQLSRRFATATRLEVGFWQMELDGA